MKGRNKYLDCLIALDNTFENCMIEKYQPVSLSKYLQDEKCCLVIL